MYKNVHFTIHLLRMIKQTYFSVSIEEYVSLNPPTDEFIDLESDWPLEGASKIIEYENIYSLNIFSIV